MVDDPHTEYDNSGLVNPDGWMQMLWYKSTTSAECKTIRIAVPAVIGSWKGHTVPLSDVFLNLNCDLKGEVDLNHNRVVGMTLMFPHE